ncbi:MAG: Holliday junction branch migration protein RuvA [Bacteroidetes bacterium]|nr:Holliday junction branch migration protein RuvA [Bacteroidota bacterium]
MYEYITGNFITKTATQIVVEANGIGYEINISLHTYSKIKDEHKGKIFLHLSIKEDAHTLYGFAEDAERKMFRHLITVNGVGTNTARMILSSLSPNDLQHTIASGNAPALQKIKGIGAKSAQKIIIDLRDKVFKEVPELAGSSANLTRSSGRSEALSALVTLGFARNSAEKALETTLKQKGETATVEELIKGALNNM